MPKTNKQFDGYQKKIKKRTVKNNNGLSVGKSYIEYLKSDWSGNGQRHLNRKPLVFGKAY